MLQEKFTAEIETLKARYPEQRSAVLPLLYMAQDTYGPLTPEVIREVADILEMPYTDVFEVVSFYTLFYVEPFGKWVIQVCDDVPCCYVGAEELIAQLKQQLGIREEEVTDDGLFSLHRVKCLASCHRAPVVQANLSYFYDVTADMAEALLNYLRRQADSPQASRVSGIHAEDFAPTPDGTFRQIERRIGPIPTPPSSGVAVAEEQKASQEAADSVPAEPVQSEAAQRADEESPVKPDPDRAPAHAHPDPQAREEERVGETPAPPQQQEPPEEQADPNATRRETE
jgi:NADH-quinone oxidoreductase subunit E